MKSISSINKSNKIESPKTPGGISKSLLTPCRRVGLSRNWRKSGSSPFISPLSSTDSTADVKQEQVSKKRKCPTEVDSPEVMKINDTKELIETNTSCSPPSTVVSHQTPTRNVLPRKKSKTLILAKECEEDNEKIPLKIPNVVTEENIDIKNDIDDSQVSKPCRTKSKNKLKIQKSPKILKPNIQTENEPIACDTTIKTNVEDTMNCDKNTTISEKKSPDNLAKECIVVIQRKIFKAEKTETNEKIIPKHSSQVLFDSDSDDIPLSNINKKECKKNVLPINEDDDEFKETKKVAVKKLQSKTTSTSELKSDTKQKNKSLKNKTKDVQKTEGIIKPSQTIHINDNDDDDFVFDKRTILVKKTYDKVARPSKVKSTGSITQKDIDDLNERIEMKKNLLLAKAMTSETAELRNLVKKWQKGCQNALSELLELMKSKMSDQQNMDYSEILQLLKIPPDLVGYDSENDCFNTPDDGNIILSGLDIA